ncbi:hypothetical protein pipiens_010482 [Culex pipiens pipiens]|uniref:Uncharacterized protein n=1 Tax=Culex pipiens pipiens TaxID=38569 RepID=A0ABD1DA34_CULPP
MKIKVTTAASPWLALTLATLLAPVLGGLLRQPKVYNAVITTDENLTPSRAYPVVQPVVHETGLAYPFGAFGPFGLYNAFNAYPGFYQPQPVAAAGGANGATPAGLAQLQGRNAAFYAGREPAPQLHETPIETIPGSKPHPETNLPLREAPAPELIPIPNNSIAPKAPEGPRPNYEVNRPEPSVDPKNQLQLNEFGLPPSLIPLYQPGGPNQQPSYNYAGNPNQQQQAYNFPSGYPYNFPVLYDSFGNYNPNQQYQSVLPPFGYYPQLAQPNPYFGQNLVPAGPVDNRNGREQDLQENAKENLQDGTPEAAPETASAESLVEPSKVEQPESDKPEVAEPAALAVEPLPESIKNNANKNKDIPDVPPPPIPSGAKEADQQ